MLPPGLGFNAISDEGAGRVARRAAAAFLFLVGADAGANATGFFPYTPATNLLFGLREALAMLEEEGLSNVFARHRRLAAAARAAVTAWELEIACAREDEHSPVLTAVMMPDSHDADRFRAVVLERFNMSLGAGLGRFKGRAFRIGHLGDFNDLMLAGTLCGVEMGLCGRPPADAACFRRRERRRCAATGRLSLCERPGQWRPREPRRALVEKRRHAFAEILAAVTQRREVVGEAVLETTTGRDAADGFLGGADGQRRVVGNGLQPAHAPPRPSCPRRPAA